MLYQRRTFTEPAGAGTGAMCTEKRHSAADARGNCLCCGNKVAPAAAEQAASIESEGYVQSGAGSRSPRESLIDRSLAWMA